MMIKRMHNPIAVVAALVVLALLFAIAGAVNSNSAPISGKTDRLAAASDSFCGDQTWPDVSPACLSWETGSPARTGFVRMVTIETRDVASRTSVLARVPASHISAD